jgi:hypothetical protein
MSDLCIGFIVSLCIRCVFTDDEYEVGDETLGKRPRTERSERPEGARTSGRTIIPRRSDNPPVIKKSTASKKRPPNPEEPEEIPDDNFGTMHAEKWREFRLRDPYHFKMRTYTGADKKFWTEGQKQMWEDHYNDKAHFKRGWVVHQHALHMTHYNNHIQEDLHFVDECVKKLDVLDIAAFKYDYYPDVIRQFHCTVYFDDDRNMTWMTGSWL